MTHLGDVTLPGNCPNDFVITRTYQAEDGCGNKSTCTQFIVVSDDAPPTVTCPAEDLVIECADPDQDQTIGEWLATASATDNNEGVQLANDDAPDRFSDGCGASGEQVVIFTAPYVQPEGDLHQEDCHSRHDCADDHLRARHDHRMPGLAPLPGADGE